MSRVREFQRCLESDRLRFVADGFEEVARETIPSLSEDVLLMERRTGLKSDDEKDRWDLLLAMLGPQVRQVVRGLMYGAKKYNENPDDPNYRKIKDATRRTTNAAIRHIVARMGGERIDEESGISHLALAVIELLFAMWHDDAKDSP